MSSPVKNEMTSNAFSGVIDAISPTECVEGWAISNQNQFAAVSVCMLWKDKPIGVGIANRFRADLVTAGIGHGWHAFRIRIEHKFDAQRTQRLSLIELKTTSLITVAELPCPETFTRTPLKLNAVLDDTGLEVTDISSLTLTKPAIDAFIAQHGVDAFVDCGYCYILGRPADPEGHASYAQLIATGKMAPLTFLATLFNSAERRESRWPVLAPSDPGYIFAPKHPSGAGGKAAVVARESGRSSNPATPFGAQPRGLGVLDARLRGHGNV